MKNTIFTATIYDPTTGTTYTRGLMGLGQALEVLRDTLHINTMVATTIINRMVDGETWADSEGLVQMMKMSY